MSETPSDGSARMPASSTRVRDLFGAGSFAQHSPETHLVALRQAGDTKVIRLKQLG